MVSKKDETRFTIKFNPENPRHQEAIRILNEVGRAKTAMIADALHLYAYNNGRMVTVIASDEVRQSTSISYAANSTEAHASPRRDSIK